LLPFGTVASEKHIFNFSEPERLSLLLKEYKRAYDFIIIDGPAAEHKLLDLLPDDLKACLVHDVRVETKAEDKHFYKQFSARLVGTIVNYAEKQTLQSFYGSSYVAQLEKKNLQSSPAGRMMQEIEQRMSAKVNNK
jgi:hypothetical protein